MPMQDIGFRVDSFVKNLKYSVKSLFLLPKPVGTYAMH